MRITLKEVGMYISKSTIFKAIDTTLVRYTAPIFVLEKE